MPEPTESTQPVKATEPANLPDPEPEPKPDSTQEIKPQPKKKKFRIGRLILNILTFLVIVGLGIASGYFSGITIRRNAQQSLITQQLSDQFSRALVDIEFGNYNTARQRLEYIIGLNPSFPGAQEKLTEVLVASSIPTATPEVAPTAELVVVNDANFEAIYSQAQQLIAAGQWQNVLTVLDTMRQKDPSYRTGEVDGMYYFSLRNLGVDLIKQGNLEGGIYDLTLAERFAPLDNTAHVLRDNARFYINAASFWELDWALSAQYFAQLNGSGIWDGTMTATERYYIAAMRYGDQLFGENRYCDAYTQYQAAQTVGQLDAEAAKNSNQAYQACYPPTPTLEPIPEATATPDGGGAPPTDTPVPTPTLP
jgi:tetratricopeptide (TPR) repeat protein